MAAGVFDISEIPMKAAEVPKICSDRDIKRINTNLPLNVKVSEQPRKSCAM